MVDACDIIKILLKNKKINTDNTIFRLHYKFTVIVLLLFSLLVTSKQYFGDPIDCHSGSKDKYIMDTYCWIYSTFTVKRDYNGVLGKNYIYPGIGPSGLNLSASGSEEIIFHKYYQWVCIVLFVQAVFFYIPRYLWKVWEGGRLTSLVKDLVSPIVQPTWNQIFKDTLVKYMSSNSYTHNIYVIRYTFCEFLNFINVTSQIFLMNLFLSGRFCNFGLSVLAFALSSESQETNPMSYAFPKLTKCVYRNYGPTGTIQQIDALCVLPLNIINEKIYVLLWVWFYFLAFISLLGLFYRVITYASKTVRAYLLIARVRFLGRTIAFNIVENISYGDWFMLNQIGKNINSEIFHELVISLGEKQASKTKGNIGFSNPNV